MQNKMTAPPLQGISNLMKMQGRMGDTELVHMSPMEVKGLASLGRLTRNPDTGLPEAFSIGGVLRDIIAPGVAYAINPALGVGYSMANTAVKGGDFGDIAIAGLATFAGGKLGEKLGGFMGGINPGTGGGAGGTVGEAGSSALADITADQAMNIGFNPELTVQGASKGLLKSAAELPSQIGSGIKSLVSDPGKALSEFGSNMASKLGETLTDPVKLGGAAGRALGGAYADAALQQKLQSEAIPEQVKEAEKTQEEFSTGKLQNMNPQYAQGELPASRIVGAMTGTAPALQFTDPSYSPAVTGSLSGILGAKNGGAMSNLKERAMGSQSKGLADALEAITEDAEDIVDMGGGQVYFEGMVKGNGDGMSDEIPFSIEGKQPALLSRDEYVLPADVVSALGNGSSNAGADMLDKFMTDVREKTMGRERQINQIG